MRTQSYAGAESLERQAQRWLEEIRASVAPRPHLRPRINKCTLLVIDMLQYFAHPSGRCYLPASTPIIANIAALVGAWRNAGGALAYTRHCHRGEHDLGMLGRFFSDYIRCGEPDAEIVPELEPRPGEPIFRKTTYDAFMDTPLQSFLEEREVQQVMITGVLTHMCCETTARSAFCRGFEVYVPVDAVASSTEELHYHSLLSMADSVAVMMSTREVLAL